MHTSPAHDTFVSAAHRYLRYISLLRSAFNATRIGEVSVGLEALGKAATLAGQIQGTVAADPMGVPDSLGQPASTIAPPTQVFAVYEDMNANLSLVARPPGSTSAIIARSGGEGPIRRLGVWDGRGGYTRNASSSISRQDALHHMRDHALHMLAEATEFDIQGINRPHP
ncbi:MAG: hypothetical protein SangKO_099870 [Sandaracinaceae bacterium]